MTLVESYTFRCIQTIELTKQAWTKNNKLKVAVNVMRMCRRMDEVVWFIATTILREDDVQRRRKVFNRWIAVGEVSFFPCPSIVLCVDKSY